MTGLEFASEAVSQEEVGVRRWRSEVGCVTVTTGHGKCHCVEHSCESLFFILSLSCWGVCPHDGVVDVGHIGRVDMTLISRDTHTLSLALNLTLAHIHNNTHFRKCIGAKIFAHTHYKLKYYL